MVNIPLKDLKPGWASDSANHAGEMVTPENKTKVELRMVDDQAAVFLLN